MSLRPTVIVVVPVYNGARHIAECIKSILAQSRSDWQALIVNNCSTDDTAARAREAAEGDPRIAVVDCDAHLPQAGNYNRAIALARGQAEFVKFIEADNWLYPTCLDAMIAVARQSPGIGLVGAGYMHGEQPVGLHVCPRQSVYDGRHAGRVHWAGHYILSSPGTLMYRASVFDDPDLRFAAGHTAMDIDLHLRIAARWDVGYVHELLTYNRDEPGVTAAFGNLMPGILGDVVCSRTYAHLFFEGRELNAHRANVEGQYCGILARALLTLRLGPSVLFKHHVALSRVSSGLDIKRLAGAVAAEIGKALLSPPKTVVTIRRRLTGEKVRTSQGPALADAIGRTQPDDGSNTEADNARGTRT